MNRQCQVTLNLKISRGFGIYHHKKTLLCTDCHDQAIYFSILIFTMEERVRVAQIDSFRTEAPLTLNMLSIVSAHWSLTMTILTTYPLQSLKRGRWWKKIWIQETIPEFCHSSQKLLCPRMDTLTIWKFSIQQERRLPRKLPIQGIYHLLQIRF